MRKTIIEKAKDPYKWEAKTKKKTPKVKLLQRPKPEEKKKPKQLYAKTGEIRTRDLSPSKFKNKQLRMKNYGRWYVEPNEFTKVLSLSPALKPF